MMDTRISFSRLESLSGISYCQSHTKRTLDVIGALVGILLYTPALILSVIALVVLDGFPVIFRQDRFGYRGIPFTILKLRTMPRAERSYEVNASYIQRKPHYQTTRTGRFFRRHSLDEIPQFWLVLRGEMSLVGHRAFPVYYVPHLEGLPGMTPERVAHYLKTIQDYKPGMTALSAVNGRANLTLQQKMAYDIEYAQTATFWGDVSILLRSIVVVLTCDGAR